MTTEPTTKPKAPRKPRATTPAKASAPPSTAPKPIKNHVLDVTREPNCWTLRRREKTGLLQMIGSFSTEATINTKFEEAGDTRRVQGGKLIEVEI